MSRHDKYDYAQQGQQPDRPAKSSSGWLRTEPFQPTCWDFCTPFLYLISMAASLMTTVSMGRVTFVWQNRAGPSDYPICVLFAASRERQYWGQHDSPACYLATFLPVAPLAAALCLCVYTLAAVVYTDRTQQTRSALGDLLHCLITLTICALCLTDVGILTDGFRNTCFGFQVEDFEYEGKVRFTSYNEVLTCKQGFDTKDRDHMVSALDTYGQLMSALIGSWINACTWLLLLFVGCTRSCHWCSPMSGGRGSISVPVAVVRRRRSGSQLSREFPELARQRRESWV